MDLTSATGTHHLSFPPASRFVVRTGTGVGRRALNAFDAALVDAGMGDYNLIRVSSILPPEAVRGDGLPLPPGSRLPVAYASELVEEPGHRISAAIAVARPADPSCNGVIMEFHAHGTADDAERIVREMAADAMDLRDLEVAEIVSSSVEAVSTERPTAVFAAVALVPADAFER